MAPKNTMHIILTTIFLILTISLSGCTTSSTNSEYTTKEKNLVSTYIEAYPSEIYPGEKFVVRYYLTNKGKSDITLYLQNLQNDWIKNMISVDCGYVESYDVVPEDISYIDLYVLKPQESILFSWTIQTYDTSINKQYCKGNINFLYEEDATQTYYIKAINEKEVATKLDIKTPETKTYGNQGLLSIKVKANPEPIIASQNKDNTFILNVYFKNDGDGTIKLKNIKLKYDESLKIDSTCFEKSSKKTLKPGETFSISCNAQLIEVPQIYEQYRVEVVARYEVNFIKYFNVKLLSKNTQYTGNMIKFTGKASYIDVSDTCSKIKISGLFGLAISLNNDYIKSLCPVITNKVIELYLQGVENYAKESYGIKEGTYWGEIFGKRYAKVFAKYTFSDINTNPPNICLSKQTYSSCNTQNIKNNLERYTCYDELYRLVDEQKIKTKLIDPRKDKTYTAIKRNVEKSLRTYKSDLERMIRDVYEKNVDLDINTINIGGIKIKTNLDNAILKYLQDHITSLIIPNLDENKDKILLKYEEGFIEGFEKGFKKALEENLAEELAIECR